MNCSDEDEIIHVNCSDEDEIMHVNCNEDDNRGEDEDTGDKNVESDDEEGDLMDDLFSHVDTGAAGHGHQRAVPDYSARMGVNEREFTGKNGRTMVIGNVRRRINLGVTGGSVYSRAQVRCTSKSLNMPNANSKNGNVRIGTDNGNFRGCREEGGCRIFDANVAERSSYIGKWYGRTDIDDASRKWRVRSHTEQQ